MLVAIVAGRLEHRAVGAFPTFTIGSSCADCWDDAEGHVFVLKGHGGASVVNELAASFDLTKTDERMSTAHSRLEPEWFKPPPTTAWTRREPHAECSTCDGAIDREWWVTSSGGIVYFEEIERPSHSEQR